MHACTYHCVTKKRDSLTYVLTLVYGKKLSTSELGSAQGNQVILLSYTDRDIYVQAYIHVIYCVVVPKRMVCIINVYAGRGP